MHHLNKATAKHMLEFNITNTKSLALTCLELTIQAPERL